MSTTCSHCYGYGHNRRGCPKRKEDLKKRADEGCEWSAEQLNKKVVRRCSFCRTEGHTRRKCEHLKKLSGEIIDLYYEADCRLARRLNELGCVPGALIEYADTRYYHGKYGRHLLTVIVVDVDWELTTPQDLGDSRWHNYFFRAFTTDGAFVNIPPPQGVVGVDDDFQSRMGVIKLVNPGTTHIATPTREQAEEKTRRLFSNKEFNLYGAESTRNRFTHALKTFNESTQGT